MAGSAPVEKPSSELKLRVISALVLGVAALAATWFGGWPFAAIWIVAAAIVADEWLRLVGANARPPRLIAAVGVLVAGLWTADMMRAAPQTGGAPLGLVILLPVVAGLIAAALAPSGVRRWVFLAAPYGAVLAVVPIVARADAIGGVALILWLFATVWLTDIAAYFAGRRFGGPKLWPAVSPKKTWSGALGGTLAGTFGGLAMVHLFGQPPLFAAWPMIGIVLYTVLASVASQGGDLLESALKRKFDVKDASHLIPGHGGLMDRLDGFWAACLLLGATIVVADAAR